MKLTGSKRAFIECSECGMKSPYFKVYLYTEEGDGYWEFMHSCPAGWLVDEEEGLCEKASYLDCLIFGYCPEHNEK